MFIVFGFFKPLESSARGDCIAKSCFANLAKGISIPYGPINESKLRKNSPTIAITLNVVHGWITNPQWLYSLHEGLYGIQFWCNGNGINHFQDNFSLNYPSGTSPLVPTGHTEIRPEFFAVIPGSESCHLYAGCRIPSNIYHHPSAFNSSTSLNLFYQPNKQKDGENGNNERRSCIHTIGPIGRIVGSIACYALVWLFGWWCVSGILDGEWKGIGQFIVFLACSFLSVIGVFIFSSGRLCLICTERDCKENQLSIDKQVQIISALAEGSGLRQIERMTGVHRDTIMRLGVRVGKACASLMDAKMRDLSCDHLQFDELWGFIGKKQKHVQIFHLNEHRIIDALRLRT